LYSDQGEDFITIPLFAETVGGAIGTKYDWNLTYAPQPTLFNRSIPVTVGKVVGGSSVLNRMSFDRGSSDDYSRWVELGATGWGFDSLLPYFKAVSNHP
jgi:choline dehydrogenase-like flavoprotein